jgi:eukaryotic-like serine/threonine-protein kinase
MDDEATYSSDDVKRAVEKEKSGLLICQICGKSFDASWRFCPHDGTLLHSDTGVEKSRVGSVIDNKYRLVRLIGTGGMAEVYEAHHLFLEKKTAVKFLKSIYASDPSVLERFRREALLISMISHPNVVTIEDFGALEDGTLFMIMELLVGETLASSIRAAPFDLREAVEIIIQACDGIAAAHEKGIIHRDLKPSNLFLVRPENGKKIVKVLDLGIAKLRNESVDNSITKTGIVVGSPNYMAPEQSLGSHIDYRSDIYGLGMVLYELVADHMPFKSKSPTDLILMHTTVEPVRPSIRAPERNIPRELDDAIMIAIAKKPEERFASIRSMADALQHVADTLRNFEAGPTPVHTQTVRTSGEAITQVKHKDADVTNTDMVKEIAPGIFWVGYRTGELLECNTYLLQFRGRDQVHTIVVDPGPYCALQIIAANISSVAGSLQAVDAIFVNHQDPDVAANSAFLQRASSRAVLWCSEDTWRLARYYDLMPERHTAIEKFWNHSTTLPTGHQIQFIPTPFCHARGAVMLYDPHSRVLFSGDLLGGLSTKTGLTGDASCWAGIRSFHELYMPSSEALKNAVAQIRALSPSPLLIAPQHGSLIPAPLIGSFLQKISELEVGINVVLDSHSKTNYLRAINEFLPAISNVLGTNRIADLIARFHRDQSFRKLFAIVDNIVVDIKMNPEAAMAVLLQSILASVQDPAEIDRIQAIALEVLQHWSLMPPEHF